MRLFRTILLVFYFSFTAALSAYAGPPKLKADTAFVEDSQLALIVYEVEPQVIVPHWSLNMLSFDVESRKWTYTLLNGWSHFGQVKGQADGRRFYAGFVKPGGVYAINNIRTQGYWEACFNGATKAFKIEPGRVNYIGVIDPNPTLKQIAESLPGETRQTVLSVFDTAILAYTPASGRENWQPDLSSFLAANYPKVTAPIVAPKPIDTSFAPGKSSVAGRICEKY